MLNYDFYNSTKVIGHFTAMVQDKSGQIGCATSSYKRGKWNWLLLACNYSYTNIIGTPVYKLGKACSGCQTGCNTDYPGLCSKSEIISPNP